MIQHHLVRLLPLIAVMSLASCGGGGGGGGGDDKSAVSATAPATSSTSNPVTPAPVAASSSTPPLSKTPVRSEQGGIYGRQTWPNGNTASGGQGQPIDGLNCAPMVENYHIHTHLAIIKDGEPLAVPNNVGVTSNCMYDMHTHDAPGILHVEGPVPKRYTLGNFFKVWGQPLSPTNVAGLTGQPIVVYINDRGNVSQYTGDFAEIDMAQGRSIVIQVGAPLKEIPTFTSSYLQ